MKKGSPSLRPSFWSRRRTSITSIRGRSAGVEPTLFLLQKVLGLAGLAEPHGDQFEEYLAYTWSTSEMLP